MPRRPRAVARRLIAGGAFGAVSLVAGAAPVSAGSFSDPVASQQNPFMVPVNADGRPKPFTITGTGWAPRTLVYVLVCDGNTPGSTNWKPTLDCDIGSEPAGARVDASGKVVFPADKQDFALTAFRGASPQQLFNCLSAHQPDPHNGLRTFRNCQVRLTPNDTVVSTDDAYLPISLPDPGSGSGASGGSAAGSSASSSATSRSTTGGGPTVTRRALGGPAGSSGRPAGGKGSLLASTGARVGLLAGLAAAAIVAGSAAVRLSRRRRGARVGLSGDAADP